MVLIDTCTLLWLAADQTKLSGGAKAIIADNAGNLYVSAITSFEIAIKHYRKRLLLPSAPQKWFPAVLEHHGIKEIPVDSGIAMASAALPSLHNDPADRIIIATAQAYNMIIVSPDHLISQYRNTEVRW
jgi:PIN domain nuclease of toxin-antitoxin system